MDTLITCGFCPKQFTTAAGYYQHYDRQHQGAKLDTRQAGRGKPRVPRTCSLKGCPRGRKLDRKGNPCSDACALAVRDAADHAAEAGTG